MKLVRLEIQNYRSVKDQTGDKAIVFDGLDCLVGKSNAGKSNILEAIRYLLGVERYDQDLHHNRDLGKVVDVRGYFQVEEADFDLLKIENKKQAIRDLVLDDGSIGICQRSDHGHMEVIGYYPQEGRLTKESFENFHSAVWEEKKSAQDFKNQMLSEYPELVEFLAEGKEQNKGEWLKAYKAFIRARPDGVKFARIPVSPPTGISADLSNMLPRPIFIPAVKEVSEVTKTTKSAELGSLLSELSGEIQEELDEAIEQAMAGIYRRLNVITDATTGEILDQRHFGVKAIEQQITDYLSETFQDISVSLEFPNPESRVMFDNARVWISEAGFERIPVDCVGQGVKRVLIFSLVRTLANLRQGQLSVKEYEEEGDQEAEKVRQPILVLYEEAELFLHPGMQTILLKALSTLKDSGDQVIFTTHSPFLLHGSLLSTINLVTKDLEEGTRITEFHSVLNEQGVRTKNRLLQVQNVSSYIFADQVVLVEGVSDQVVLKKLARALSPEWDFEQKGIPVLSVAGKGDLPIFRAFLAALKIETFVVTDLDAVKETVVSLCDNSNVKRVRDEVRKRAKELIDEGKALPRINRKYVDRLSTSHRWNHVFDELEQLCAALHRSDEPTEEQMGSLEKLLLKRENDAEMEALGSEDPEMEKLRANLTELLLDENVLLLNGTIENYYAGGSSRNKIKAALDFDPAEISEEEIRSRFVPIREGRTTDMEEFLHRLFGS